MKKLLLILAAAMLLMGGAAQVRAEEHPGPAVQDGLVFTFSGGHAILSETTGAAGEVTVPDSVNGYPVQKIEGQAFSGSAVTSVTLPDSVRSIEWGGLQKMYVAYNCTDRKWTGTDRRGRVFRLYLACVFSFSSYAEKNWGFSVFRLQKVIGSLASARIEKTGFIRVFRLYLAEGDHHPWQTRISSGI